MSTQPLAFGEKLPSSGNSFLRIKQKGDKVQFRIAQNPVYTGKHFTQTENGWDIIECPRIMKNEECDKCEKFFELKDKIKKGKADNSLTASEIKQLDNEARDYGAAIEFYFPILDRADGKFKILQTTNGVRNKFNVQFEAGIDVMETEWILANTGSASPAERYMLTPVDSSKVKKMAPEEDVEFEKAKKFDMSTVGGSSSDDEI